MLTSKAYNDTHSKRHLRLSVGLFRWKISTIQRPTTALLRGLFESEVSVVKR